MRQAVLAALDGFALIWGLAVGPFSWLLRDGLGPGSVDSHGAHAVARFLLTFYWGPVLVALLALRLLLRRRPVSRHARAADA